MTPGAKSAGLWSLVRHSLFADQPMMALRYGSLPCERSLAGAQEDAIRRFPPDYIANLRTTILRINPDLAGRAQEKAAKVVP